MNPNKVFTVKRKFEYNVKISGGTKTCFINGICIMPSGRAIIVDSINTNVKLLDQQFKLVSHCDISGLLKGICLTTSSQVA
ncbi:hypothetical protein DPMN_100984 [Dreissena polymorpha]|uniref:Uncharacterized protein n=1 Tax=Dreissena polymorpha TaxID=45954 RepID=A0A9D4R7X5_DREPO|nr:hypothetical protein DPMN_100984 [Dreissena polymorpha]